MANYKEWHIQMFNARKNEAITDAAAVGVVMAGGTTGRSDLVTLVSGQGGASLTQPVTLANGALTFYTAKTVTAVDISIMLATGHSVYARGVTSSTHRLDVYTEQKDQVLVAPFLFNSGGTVTDTGFDFPAGCLIHDAAVWVGVADATETIDVGFINAVESGDEDGLLDGVDIAAVGYVESAPVATGGVNIDFLAVTTYGVLLASAITGTDVVAVNGAYARKRYLTDGTIKSLSYTPSAGDTGTGLILISYSNLLAAGLS